MFNINLITYFNVAPVKNGANDRTFEEVNAVAAQYGYLIHPDCCTIDVLKWLNTYAKTQYNKTFYNEWQEITSKTRFELLVDQLKHYASTYGTDFAAGEGYKPNNADAAVIPYEKFKVILPATEEEFFNRSKNMLCSGIALKDQTSEDLVTYIVDHVADWVSWSFDLDAVTNKEALVKIAAKTDKYPTDSFGLLRCLVYKTTGSAMLIKSNAVIKTIKANVDKIDLTKLSDKQVINLSKIFHRYKPLFLAMKHGTDNNGMFSEAFKKAAKKIGHPIVAGKTNASVVNKLRKLANTHHTPMQAGFWETVISQPKSIESVKAKLGEITNFKKITLMQCIKERLIKQNGQVYVIRNGKVFVREGYQPKSDATYLMNLYLVLQNSVVDSIKGKACVVKYMKNVNFTIPTSEKNFVGNYPFGTNVNLGEDHSVVGIYWRNEWHTNDFDLHFINMEGGHVGWNSSYHSDGMIFSGDVTNAPNGATELFYIPNKCKDGKFSVNRFRGEGAESQFKFFISTESEKVAKQRDPMIDPNTIVAEFMIPTDRRKGNQTEVAMVVDNKFYLMDLTSGSKIVSGGEREVVMIDKMKNKARSFIDLKEILDAAGFTAATDETPEEEIGLDLTSIDKDTLIKLFA